MFPEKFVLCLAKKMEEDKSLCKFVAKEIGDYWINSNLPIPFKLIYKKAIANKLDNVISVLLSHILSDSVFKIQTIESIWHNFYSTPQATKKLFLLLQNSSDDEIKSKNAEFSICYINKRIEIKKKNEYEKRHPSKVTPLITHTYNKFMSLCDKIEEDGVINAEYIEKSGIKEIDIYI